MEIRDANAMKSFSAEKMKKMNLFETERMFCDVYCFEPGQSQKPHIHPSSDKVYFVLEGRGKFKVADQEAELSPGMATIVPPGADHGVTNHTSERLVVLVFMTPKP